MIKNKEEYGNKVITMSKNGAVLKCPGCGNSTLLSELIWEKGVAKCRWHGCDWKFKITWGAEKKERIYKTKPKDADDYCVTHYSIPQGRDEKGHTKPWKERKLKIGDKYDIVTNEAGQEIYFTGRFVGWRDDTIITNDGKRLPGNISYLALFEAVGYIEVDTDYSLSITKAEEKEK